MHGATIRFIYVYHHRHHHHHTSFMELGHLLTRSGLMYPEVSSKVYHDYFCQLRSITVSPGMEEMPSLNMPVHRLKVAILPLDLPCSGTVTHSGEILITGKSHGKGQIFFKQQRGCGRGIIYIYIYIYIFT